MEFSTPARVAAMVAAILVNIMFVYVDEKPSKLKRAFYVACLSTLTYTGYKAIFNL